MSILAHPDWPALRQWFRIERYEREPTPRDPRWRIEVLDPPDGRWALLTVEVPCVACGAPIHPIRARANGGALYFAAGCPVALRPACSKGAAATAEYRAVRDDIEGSPVADAQMGLF